ncbi:MAG TPA: sialidase family protein, partial [Marmoricola sp.]|nr:sialidase family protein [Marmoricola sp.]
MPNGFMVDLMGSTVSGAQVNPIVRVAFGPDGSVSWYQGREGFAGPRWLPVASSGGPSVGKWSTVDIATTTDMDMAYVSVNGSYLGTAGVWSVNPATRIGGFRLSGVGTSVTGDTISFGSPGLFPAISQRPAPVSAEYGFGHVTTIAASGGAAAIPYQMPTAVVRAPLATGGYRLIADYPMHTDSGVTTGNEMVTSVNHGKTWRLVTNNPLPDIPGLNLTRLADGTLLATGYHTYAQLDGQQVPSNEAVAVSAISTDAGTTWSSPRYGTVTNSDAFDEYPCEVASGCQKLLFVHSAIEADGRLYQSAYGQNANDPQGSLRQYVLVSADNGQNWFVRSSLTSASFAQGFAEGALAWAPDGGMIVVMRTGSYSPMYIARSGDRGATWSAPELLSDAGGEPIMSIYPNLARLDDGSLLLMTGRPGMSLTRSTDGGRTWSRSRAIDYTNSGNGSMTDLGNNTVLVLGDRGADWSGPANPGVWCRQITVFGN